MSFSRSHFRCCIFVLFLMNWFKYKPFRSTLDEDLQDGPQKCPYFSWAITFTKIRKPSQLLEVYRILLVETTLESIMFYNTFSLINTIFVACTVLLYDSTAATWTLKLSTILLSMSCGIHLIYLLMISSLVCGLFSQTLSLMYPLRK